MRQAKTKIIDSLPQLGGQLATLYPEKYIYDIPGYPAIKASELIDQLEKQLTTFNHTFHLKKKFSRLLVKTKLSRSLQIKAYIILKQSF